MNSTLQKSLMNVPRDVGVVLYHGASPGRWAEKGATVKDPVFKGGCFLTPDPLLASMYCADWRSRDDKVEFLQVVINDFLKIFDPEELLMNGLAEVGEDGLLRLTQSTSASHLLQTRTTLDISHNFVRPTIRSVHHYPEGSVMFPFWLRSENIKFLDCENNHFDDLPGELVGRTGERFRTDDVVEAYRGKVEVLWFMNLTDPAHTTSSTPGDTVFVYSPESLVFKLSNQSPFKKYGSE